MAYAYVRSVAPSVGLVGHDALARAWSEIQATTLGRRRIVYYWTEADVPLIIYERREGGALGEDLTFVHDRTIGGRLARELLERDGRRVFELRHAHPGRLARDVGELARSSWDFGIAVDGRGPYGRVHPGVARIAAQCEAVVVPLGVAWRRSLSVRLSGPLQLPRRGAAISVMLGAPLDARTEAGLDRSMQRNLDRACAEARTALAELER